MGFGTKKKEKEYEKKIFWRHVFDAVSTAASLRTTAVLQVLRRAVEILIVPATAYMCIGT